MNTAVPRTWFLNTILCTERNEGFLEKWPILRLRQERYKMSLEQLVLPESNAQKYDRGMLQRHRCKLEEALTGQIRENLSTKIQ